MFPAGLEFQFGELVPGAEVFGSAALGEDGSGVGLLADWVDWVAQHVEFNGLTGWPLSWHGLMMLTAGMPILSSWRRRGSPRG
jgi:hypothetical protein